MAKKQLVDFVNQLKQAGINISFTKPKAEFFSLQNETKPTSTIN